MKYRLSLIVVIALLNGCADPLTKALKKSGFVPSVPVSSTQAIGDIYREPTTKSRPVVLMRRVFPEGHMNDLMEKFKDETQLADESGSSSYKLSLTADLIGQLKAEAAFNHVDKFTIRYRGAVRYILSDYDWVQGGLYDSLAAKVGADEMVDKYVVSGLLEVKSLEYELYNENGGKINVEPGSQIETVFKGKLGLEWSANSNKNFSFDSPKFIGYQLARVKKGGSLRGAPAEASGSPIQRLSRQEMLPQQRRANQ